MLFVCLSGALCAFEICGVKVWVHALHLVLDSHLSVLGGGALRRLGCSK